MTSADGGGWSKYYRAATQYGNTPEQREPGARRKRLQKYLQAANELRQSYTAAYAGRSSDSSEAWPDAGITRGGNEELILFPSYARIRVPSLESAPQAGSTPDNLLEEDWTQPQEDSVYDDSCLVDIDVRGWLYTPQTGPMGRANKSMFWMARQLCGLPAQTSAQTEPPVETLTEEEAAVVRSTTPSIVGAPGYRPRTPPSPDSEKPALPKRASWRSSDQQSVMTPAELTAAHEALAKRFAPFTHRPVARRRLTIFLFNNEESQSRTLWTSDNGHFSTRIPLPFIPTHVRVLAAEQLSATEEIRVYVPEGVSLISDIDDTVKHSAISLGTREVFRNTFTAPLSSLSVPGVASWYRALHDAPYNVDIHYVSNSPWQLFPVLKEFFATAGLPPGSIHLKRYSGVLQGIFEPAADKKKGTVERVIRDFPLRKWLLVGDSGEADLEVYTEIAERYSDRILAVLIRDITSSTVSTDTDFFDSNKIAAGNGSSGNANGSHGRAITPPPLLPPRITDSDLIDLSDPVDPQSSRASMDTVESRSSKPALSSNPPLPPRKPKRLQSPPVPPPKPSGLQRHTSHMDDVSELESGLYDGSGYGATQYIPGRVPRPNAAASDLPATPTPTPVHPPLPPRRTQTTPAKLAPVSTTVDPINKKEDLWRRRWDRSRTILEMKGIPLISWRSGTDVQERTVSIVEKALRAGRGQPGGPTVIPPGRQ